MEMKSNIQALPVVSVHLDTDDALLSAIPILTAKDAIAFVSAKMFDMAEERAVAIFEDQTLTPLCVSIVGQGTQKGVMFSARDIVQTALLCNASYVTIIHNHPGYNTDKRIGGPSKEDILVTDTIVKACSIVDVLVYDSIVVSGYKTTMIGTMIPCYYSIREHNYRRIKRKLGIKDVDHLPTSEHNLKWELTIEDRTGGEDISDPAICSEKIEYVVPQTYEQKLRNQKLPEYDYVEDVEVFAIKK